MTFPEFIAGHLIQGGVKGFKGQEKYVGIDGAGAVVVNKTTVNAAIVKCRGDENCHGFTSKAGLNKTAINEVCYKTNLDMSEDFFQTGIGDEKNIGMYVKKRDLEGEDCLT